MLVSKKHEWFARVLYAWKEKLRYFIEIFYLRHESRRCENYISKNRVSMANIRLRILWSETEHRTKLSRIVINRHQQTRCEPHTSSVKGNWNNLTLFSLDEVCVCVCVCVCVRARVWAYVCVRISTCQVINIIFLVSTIFCQVGYY